MVIFSIQIIKLFYLIFRKIKDANLKKHGANFFTLQKKDKK